MKARIIKWYNLFLGALLGFLGFSSCDPIHLLPRLEYGQPHADYKLVGSVKDQAGKPIQGIRVSFHPNLENTSDEVNAMHTDTLYSDASGKFSKDALKYTWPNLTRAVVEFEDIDGPDNGGSFKKLRVSVGELEVSETQKGDGNWYGGAQTITADVKMEKE